MSSPVRWQSLPGKGKTFIEKCRGYLGSILRRKRPLAYTPIIDDKLFLFVGGLHRSGTSIVHRLLREHPETTGFTKSGSREDEGQHIQTVFATARDLGGPGRFAFNGNCHLTEFSELVSETNRKKLLREWCAYYDLEKRILLEKSPPNLVRSRFLQAMFPHSVFVFVVRHPIPVSLSTQRWSKAPLSELFHHWYEAHRILFADLDHLRNKLVVRYEDLVASPDIWLRKIFALAGTSAFEPRERLVDHNLAYYSKWQSGHCNDRDLLVAQSPEVVQFAHKLGYSLDDPFVV